MKTKPLSANTKKSVILDKQLIAKKPTLVKCYICNQMFYSQQTFDIHFDQHQKKVDKHLPEQIQRKTLESFGLKRKQSMNKKNTTLQAINQNQITDKKILSKTLKIPLVTGEKIEIYQSSYIQQVKSSMNKKLHNQFFEVTKKKQESIQKQEIFSKKESQDKQIQQIDEAIRQSSLLMSQIAFITERAQHQNEINAADEAQSEQEEYEIDQTIEKTESESQFIKNVRQNNDSLNKIQQKLLRVNFIHHKELQNCQIQIQYLKKISRLSSNLQSSEKISKIKSKVLMQIINLIMANEAPINQHQKHKNLKIQSEVKEEENLNARTCCYCLDMIGFGQTCSIQGSQSFHQECFAQLKKQTA